MRSKVQHTSATRERVVAKPRLVRSIAIVKLRINRKDLPKLTVLDKRINRLHRRYRAVRQINSEQTICIASRLDDSSRFKRIAAERLLTEHRDSSLECRNGLLGVKAIGRSDYDSIEIVIEQLVESREHNRVGRELQPLRSRISVRVVDGRDFRNPGLHDRLKTIPSNPAKPDKA